MAENYIVLGAYSPLKSNEPAQKIADAVKAELEEKVGQKFEMYTAILYKTQVVKGLNYLISVQIGVNSSCHIVVHEHLDKSICLGAFQMDMELYAPLHPIGINVPLPSLR